MIANNDNKRLRKIICPDSVQTFSLKNWFMYFFFSLGIGAFCFIILRWNVLMFSFETTKTRIFRFMFIIGINDFFVKEHWDPDYIIFSEDKFSFISKLGISLSCTRLLWYNTEASVILIYHMLIYSEKKSVTKFMFRDILCLHANSLFGYLTGPLRLSCNRFYKDWK